MSDAIDTLLTRAQREIDAGLLPSCQIALARNGELEVFEAFGEATTDTRYIVFSATKAFVASLVWVLIGEGLIDVRKRVVDYIPEFAPNGKDVITVEQVMLHTSGFPLAPMPPLLGATSEGRVERFAKWRLNWDPGTKYQYHPTSAHWVLAEIIERVTGQDFRDVVEQRVTTPAGLPRVLSNQDVVAAELILCGEHASPDELEAVFGVRQLDVGEVTDEALVGFNDLAAQRVGVPGGGGVMRACDLAMYYQAVLHNPGQMWKPDVIKDVRSNVRNHLPDVMTGIPANRTLGLIQAGDDGKTNLRGMGHTVSPLTVGHNGAGGQIAWGDPATGISLGYTTNGLDRHEVREPRRTSGIASAAGRCGTR